MQKTEYPKTPKMSVETIMGIIKPQKKENDITKTIYTKDEINADLEDLYRAITQKQKSPDYSNLPDSVKRVLESISGLVRSNSKALNKAAGFNNNALNVAAMQNNLMNAVSGINAKNIPKRQNMLYNDNKNKNSNITSLSNSTSNASVKAANINALKDRIIKEGGVDLSDPKNSDAVRVVRKLVGMPENGGWSPELMNRLQDYLLNGSDQFDAQTYKLTDKNLETLTNIYWSDYYTKKKNDQNEAAVKAMEEQNKKELLDLKQNIISKGSTDLSDPNNKETVKAVQRAIGMTEDGIWSPQVLDGLKVFLTSRGDQFDENTLTLTNKNLDTVFGVGNNINNSLQENSNETKENISNNSNIDENTQINSGTPSTSYANTEEFENDIWKQADYIGAFDGLWYLEKEKVMAAASVLLDEARQNGGLNLRELQKNKVKRELFKALLYLLREDPRNSDNLVDDSLDFEAVADANGWGEVNPFNVTPGQLDALIERFDQNMNLTKEQLQALRYLGAGISIVAKYPKVPAIIGAAIG